MEKKMAVALDSPFFNTLPNLKEVSRSEAEVAWLVYDLVPNETTSRYNLERTKVVYTKFTEALNSITRPKVGKIDDFMKLLQAKVDEKLESPPINKTIENPFTS